MQVKKITAKIRDMVRVSLMENGDERAWYNNIELPDEIRALEVKDFGFRTMLDGKIEFQITFEPGILPKTFPEKKARKRRTSPPATTTPSIMTTPTSTAKDSTSALEARASAKPAAKPTIKATTKVPGQKAI